jgi:hypothetical protein
MTHQAPIPEGWEDWLAFFSSQLPQPLHQEEQQSGIVYLAGDPGEVIVELTPNRIRVAEFTVRWDGQMAAVTPRWLGSVMWRRMPPNKAISLVEGLLQVARDVRRSRFQTCILCSQLTPPELMTTGEICHDCAMHEPGVVH